MRRLPPISAVSTFPVTGVVGTASIVLTLAFWTHRDVDVLLPRSDSWPFQPWQLLTNIFFHVDVFHLVFNLYWFYHFGTLVEKVFGPVRFLGMVLLFAVGSSAAEYAFLRAGIGLSGVGYGLFGFIWIMSRRDSRFADAIDLRTIQVFIVWFVLCIVLTAMHVWMVANIAHGAGMVLGLLLAECVSKRTRRVAVGVGIGSLVVLLALLATVGREYVNFTDDAAFALDRQGYFALTSGRNEEAAALFRRSIDAGTPNQEFAWRSLGIAEQRQGHVPEALKAYRR